MSSFPSTSSCISNKISSVAVVGAGVAGLVSAKALLEQGIVPVVFEQHSDLGGVWLLDSAPRGSCDTRAKAYNSLFTNTSRKMMEFSDLPFDVSDNEFLSHTEILRYYRQYAEQNQLVSKIRFATVVNAVERQAAGYRVTSTSAGQQRQESFDAVLCCSGQFSTPKFPTFPGQSRFAGRVLHSSAYREPTSFADKRVVVLGLGSTALDVALDLVDVADKVFLSGRSSAFFVPSTTASGYPIDLAVLNRFNTYLSKSLYAANFYRQISWFVTKAKSLNIPVRLDNNSVFTIVKNPHKLFAAVESGKLRFVGGLASFESRAVRLQDDTIVACDDVLLCTGYTTSYPFLAPDLNPVVLVGEQQRVWLRLWKMCISNVTPTLAFIGLADSIGNVGVVAELQARFVAALLSGRIALPSQRTVDDDVSRAEQWVVANEPRYPMFLKFPQYMDDLATRLGCRAWWLSHPRHAYQLLFGPLVAANHRLVGECANRAAAGHILSKL